MPQRRMARTERWPMSSPARALRRRRRQGCLKHCWICRERLVRRDSPDAVIDKLDPLRRPAHIECVGERHYGADWRHCTYCGDALDAGDAWSTSPIGVREPPEQWRFAHRDCLEREHGGRWELTSRDTLAQLRDEGEDAA
jgi:hypothetical protein